jgi:sugar phosphate isomerase/epimerase
MRVAYSTLACPDWTLEQTITAALEYGYEGLDLRLLEGQTVGPDLSAIERVRVRRRLAETGLTLTCLAADVKIADPTPGAALASGQRNLDLAVDLGAPLMRVWGGRFAGQSVAEAEARALDVLGPLGEYGASVGVRVALETHDVFTSAAQVARLLAQVDHPNVGAIWDWMLCFLQGEHPDAGQTLTGRVFSVHMKDGYKTATGWQPTPFGEGTAPLASVFDGLQHLGYDGWLTVEWEKKWHPDIDPPEVALPREREALRRFGI